ncbi:MAG: Ig-like domain-containing protein [Bacilli bacterium]
MAKSDFNVEEPEYYEKNDEIQPEGTKQTKTNEEEKDLYHQDYGENSDFSKIGINKDLEYIDDADVVYEDKENKTSKEKLDDAFSTINKRALIVVGGIFLLVIVIIMMILLTISKYNKGYKTTVIIPEIVYLGETGNISVLTKGKKDIEKTLTTFTSKNNNIITILNNEMEGEEILNTIIPIQEGRAKINIVSKLKNKEMANETKEIVVCPAFTSKLLLSKNISVVQDNTYNLPIDFGEKECGEGITYESSNDNIMTVSETGNIKGIKPGTAILTVKKGHRTISVNVEVTKEYIEMKNLEIIPDEVQLKPGEITRINIDYSPKNATSTNIHFYSTKSNIVTISEGGLIKALKPGTATINAKSSNGGIEKKVEVVVSEEISSEGTEITEMKLNKTIIKLVQGESEKIMATVTPSSAKDKTINWESSNENIATVTNEGVIFAKKEGSATITATTKNNISKTVQVMVTEMKLPKISASDNIQTNQWHNKPYTLKFYDSENGSTYYYGKTEDNMTNKGSKITISNDEKVTYYVKACKNGVCSGTVTYISKLDITKPRVLTVAGIENSAVKEDSVQIALKDTTSLVQKWCVTNIENYSTCQWKTIKTMASPVVAYTARYNSTYYVYAKDSAGNISDSYMFEITNIE